MAYRNKTYVIFDGDEDMWAYAYMLGWTNSDHIDFNFYNAHDIRPLAGTSSETAVKSALKQRLANTKQAIVIVGEKTKNLYRFVRWEIEMCLNLGIPIVVVNLNGMRKMDAERCPPILKGTCSLHVPFKAKAVQRALDDFCDNFRKHKESGLTDAEFKPHVYSELGL